MEMLNPTKDAYEELQHCFDHYNQRLFANELPACLITMQRKNQAYGYFSHSCLHFQTTLLASLALISLIYLKHQESFGNQQ